MGRLWCFRTPVLMLTTLFLVFVAIIGYSIDKMKKWESPLPAVSTDVNPKSIWLKDQPVAGLVRFPGDSLVLLAHNENRRLQIWREGRGQWVRLEVPDSVYSDDRSQVVPFDHGWRDYFAHPTRDGEIVFVSRDDYYFSLQEFGNSWVLSDEFPVLDMFDRFIQDPCNPDHLLLVGRSKPGKEEKDTTSDLPRTVPRFITHLYESTNGGKSWQEPYGNSITGVDVVYTPNGMALWLIIQRDQVEVAHDLDDFGYATFVNKYYDLVRMKDSQVDSTRISLEDIIPAMGDYVPCIYSADLEMLSIDPTNTNHRKCYLSISPSHHMCSLHLPGEMIEFWGDGKAVAPQVVQDIDFWSNYWFEHYGVPTSISHKYTVPASNAVATVNRAGQIIRWTKATQSYVPHSFNMDQSNRLQIRDRRSPFANMLISGGTVLDLSGDRVAWATNEGVLVADFNTNTIRELSKGCDAERTILYETVSPDRPEIHVATNSMGIYRTKDGGENWEQISKLRGGAIAFFPTTPGRLVRFADVKIYISTDYGTSWKECHQKSHLEVHSDPQDYKTPQITFSQTNPAAVDIRYSRVLYHSGNNGETWPISSYEPKTVHCEQAVF